VVRGARITGRAMPLSRVRVSLDVRANGKRRFTWRSSTRADETGRYSITVPYSTEFREGVRAEGPYRVLAGGGRPIAVRVPEEAVLRSAEVRVGP